MGICTPYRYKFPLSARDPYIELRNFYGSEKWFEYMEIEKITVKCGVLSEDQLYDMIGEHNELLGALLDLTSKMYKNF